MIGDAAPIVADFQAQVVTERQVDPTMLSVCMAADVVDRLKRDPVGGNLYRRRQGGQRFGGFKRNVQPLCLVGRYLFLQRADSPNWSSAGGRRS
jgi:hypothetical protein